MKTLPISRYRFFQKLQPLSLLMKISSKSVTGCLQVFSITGSWSFYVEDGKLTYACCWDRMFEILYRNLQRLSQQTPISKGIYQQLRAIFETGIDNEAIQNPDYLAICWLVTQKYITPVQAGMLIEQLAIEVLESFLKLEEGSYEFTHDTFLDDMPKFCHLNLRSLFETSQKRSLYRKNAESQAAQFSRQSQAKQNHAVRSHLHVAVNSIHRNYEQSKDKKVYKIFCIDDSPTVLNAMKSFLDEQMFSVIAINEPLKALMQIIRTKPDIILLDIEMPALDGYELCSLLRKHSYFKNTPVIMVTGRTGLIDRARAKIVRSSGYLTKPFTQADLLKTIFQHIA